MSERMGRPGDLPSGPYDMDYYAQEWEREYGGVDFDAIENDMPRCQPIGCDNGIHLPGCEIVETESASVPHDVPVPGDEL